MYLLDCVWAYLFAGYFDLKGRPVLASNSGSPSPRFTYMSGLSILFFVAFHGFEDFQAHISSWAREVLSTVYDPLKGAYEEYDTECYHTIIWNSQRLHLLIHDQYILILDVVTGNSGGNKNRTVVTMV